MYKLAGFDFYLANYMYLQLQALHHYNWKICPLEHMNWKLYHYVPGMQEGEK